MSSAKYFIGWVRHNGREGHRNYASLAEARIGYRELKKEKGVVSGGLYAEPSGERVESFWYANIEQQENYGF